MRTWHVNKDLRSNKKENGVLVDNELIVALIKNLVKGPDIAKQIESICQEYQSNASEVLLPDQGKEELFGEILSAIAIDRFATEYQRQIQEDIQKSTEI